jgi:hypothetical protein
MLCNDGGEKQTTQRLQSLLDRHPGDDLTEMDLS